MTRQEYLTAYTDGFANRDIDTLLSSLADGYVMDDPNAGKIPKSDMQDYMTGFSVAVDGMRGADDASPLLVINEELTRDDGAETTVLVVWNVPNTPMEGAGLIIVGDDGVRSERLTYYAKIAA